VPASLEALVAPHLRQLRQLRLAVDEFDAAAAVTLATVTQLTLLELTISGDHDPDGMIQSHFPLMSQLRSLNFTNFTESDLIGMEAFTAMTQLTYLRAWSGYGASELPVANTLAHMVHLRSLSLGSWRCWADDDDPVSDDDDPVSAWQALGNALPTMVHLTNLELADILLDDFDPSHFKALAPGLAGSNSLLELRIFGRESDELVFDAADHNASAGRALLDSVAGLTKLQVLCIDRIPLKQSDCHMHLTSLTALTSLSLTLPIMAPAGFDSGGLMAGMLQGMPLLTSLGLSTEGMGSLCMTSLFADTLPSMPQLESLMFLDCDNVAMCSVLAGKVREHHMPHLTKCRVALSEEQCAMVNSIACQNLFHSRR
jgi:hypothetical protein